MTTTDPDPVPSVARKHPLAKCEECPLYAKGKYVPTRFPNDPTSAHPVVFVGEAPGNQERITGEPFVGPSGKLLHRVLQEYGLSREDVTLTNSTSCHYPPSMGGMPPEAVDACRPRLVAEIEQALPEDSGGTVVLMGNTALSSLSTDKAGVTAQRVGPPRLTVDHPHLARNLRTVATFHPASVLRNHDQLPFLEADIGKALDAHLPGDLAWREPDIRILNGADPALTRQQWWSLLRDLCDYPNHSPLVVDTESGQDKDTAEGVGENSPVLCIGLSTTEINPDSPVYVVGRELFDQPEILPTLHALIAAHGMVAQNGKHDAEVLTRFFRATLGIEQEIELVFDTMLGHYALRETSGIHGLKYMLTEYIGTPPYDEQVNKLAKVKGAGGRKDFGQVPTGILYTYNGWDVGGTRLIYHWLIRKLVTDPTLLRLNKHFLRASPMLQAVERRGMKFDSEYSQQLSTEYQSQLVSDEEIGLNPRSPKQIKEYFQSRGYKAPDTTEATITKLAARHPDDETLPAILENRKITKIDGTYVTGLQKRVTSAGRIHASFRLHGTTTGRLASRNPNFQNMPSLAEIKRQFTVDSPGYTFIHRDYSQIELRVMAWLAGDTFMRDLFNDPNRDVFDELQAGMWGQAEFDRIQQDPASAKFYRRLIKTFAYGIAYDRGADSIAAAFNISRQRAREQMASFHAMIPDIMAFQEEVVARVHRGEDLINPFGRHRRFYLITSANQDKIRKEAMAYLPQSTASDICVSAAYMLHERHKLDIRNLIHDAILAHAHHDEADEISRIMDEVMVEAAREVTGGYVDFATEVTMGSTWGDV